MSYLRWQWWFEPRRWRQQLSNLAYLSQDLYESCQQRSITAAATATYQILNLRQSNGLGIKVHSSIWDPRGFVLDAAVPGGNWKDKKPVQEPVWGDGLGFEGFELF